jgi:hypothetical protein
MTTSGRLRSVARDDTGGERRACHPERSEGSLSTAVVATPLQLAKQIPPRRIHRPPNFARIVAHQFVTTTMSAPALAFRTTANRPSGAMS